MLRDFTDVLFRHLLHLYPADRAYGRTALEQESMPQPVAHFLRRRLQHRLSREVEALHTARSDWFDYDHPDVQQAQQTLLAALSEQARIPQKAWAGTLREAVERVATYLVRPVKALVDFTFGDEHERLPLERIQEQLSFFTAYPYFREVLGAYFQQKGLREIDRAHFTSLLSRIDREMTRDYDADAWLRLLAPLFALARTAPAGQQGVSVALLRAFFSGKDLEGIQHRLRQAQERGRERLDEEELRELLEAAPAEAAPAPQPAPARHPQPPTPAASPPQAVPLWKRFQQSGAPVPPERSAPSSQPPDSRPAPPRKPGQPLWMQFEPARPHPPSNETPPRDALEQTVLGPSGAKNRDMYIEHLFSGSPAEYERVLRQLQAAATWPEASRVIAQEVFRKHRVNIYSDPALAFTDAVEAQYRKR